MATTGPITSASISGAGSGAISPAAMRGPSQPASSASRASCVSCTCRPWRIASRDVPEECRNSAASRCSWMKARYARTSARTPVCSVRVGTSAVSRASSRREFQRVCSAVDSPSTLPKWWYRLPMLTPLAAVTAVTVRPLSPVTA